MAKSRDDYKIIHAPSGIFKFSNHSCTCVVDKRHDEYGNPKYILKVKTADGEIPFRHHFKGGIKLINDHGDDIHTPIREIPHTQEYIDIHNLLGIKSDVPMLNKDIITEERFAHKLENYFKKYGFLFPLESLWFEEFDPMKTGALFDRISILLDLMNAVDGTDVDYDKIFNLTFMLALKQLDKFENYSKDKTYAESFSHPLLKTFKSIDYSIKGHSLEVREDELTNYFNLDAEKIDKKLYNTGIDYETGFKMEHGEPVPPEHYYDIYIIKDYFIGDDEWFLLRVGDYENTIEESLVYDAPIEVKHIFNTEKRIKYMFTHADFEGREDKLFFDFLFHLHYQVCKIISINPSARFPVRLEEGVSLNRNKKFDERFRKTLRELANITIKNEIDYMTSSVKTDYNIETKSQGWRIPDLYTAIYYSIFLTDRQNIVFRVCANPYCQGNFEVAATNDRRKYCSENCQRVSAQRLKRANDNLKEGENKAKIDFLNCDT